MTFVPSYGDFTLQMMTQLRQSEIGISEYTLAKTLCDYFHLSIPEEAECLEMLRDQMENIDGVELKKNCPEIPYRDGFTTDSGEFEFIDEVELGINVDNDLFLITCKAPRSLNSQFHREEGIFLNPECGFNEGEAVRVSTKVGEVSLVVRYDSRLRNDCALIYAGTPEVNVLTPSLLSLRVKMQCIKNLK